MRKEPQKPAATRLPRKTVISIFIVIIVVVLLKNMLPIYMLQFDGYFDMHVGQQESVCHTIGKLLAVGGSRSYLFSFFQVFFVLMFFMSSLYNVGSCRGSPHLHFLFVIRVSFPLMSLYRSLSVLCKIRVWSCPVRLPAQI